MRILIGIACLVLVFGISSLWHRSEMDDFRAQAGLGGQSVVKAAEVRNHPAGWGEVIVGSPSQAEPIYVAPSPPRTRARRLTPPDQLGSVNEEASNSGSLSDSSAAELSTEGGLQAPADWELVVGSGDVLSRIVRVHYGRVSPELEQRLAEYNGLSSPDKLKVGQTLYLPAEELLLDEPK